MYGTPMQISKAKPSNRVKSFAKPLLRQV